WCVDPPWPRSARFRARECQLGELRRAPSRAPPRELCLRRQRRHPRAPSILGRPILFQRARLDQLTPSPGADGSRSNGPNTNLPLRPVTFAKETLPFLDINPQSCSVLKYSQKGPELYTKPPGFSRNRTRRP